MTTAGRGLTAEDGALGTEGEGLMAVGSGVGTEGGGLMAEGGRLAFDAALGIGVDGVGVGTVGGRFPSEERAFAPIVVGALAVAPGAGRGRSALASAGARPSVLGANTYEKRSSAPRSRGPWTRSGSVKLSLPVLKPSGDVGSASGSRSLSVERSRIGFALAR